MADPKTPERGSNAAEIFAGFSPLAKRLSGLLILPGEFGSTVSVVAILKKLAGDNPPTSEQAQEALTQLERAGLIGPKGRFGKYPVIGQAVIDFANAVQPELAPQPAAPESIKTIEMEQLIALGRPIVIAALRDGSFDGTPNEAFKGRIMTELAKAGYKPEGGDLDLSFDSGWFVNDQNPVELVWDGAARRYSLKIQESPKSKDVITRREELSEEIVAQIRRQLFKILLARGKPTRPISLMGALGTSIRAAEPAIDIGSLKPTELLADGFLADGKIIIWDAAAKTYEAHDESPAPPADVVVEPEPAVPLDQPAPQPAAAPAPKTVSAAPVSSGRRSAASVESREETWKTVSEIPEREREEIAQVIFERLFQVGYLRRADFTGMAFNRLVEGLSPEAKQKLTPALVGLDAEPETFGALFVEQGIALPPDTNAAAQQVTLRPELRDLVVISYRAALEAVDVGGIGPMPSSPTKEGLAFQERHPKLARIWDRLMQGRMRQIRPDPAQLGMALGLRQRRSDDGRRSFAEEDWAKIRELRGTLIRFKLIQQERFERDGKTQTRSEFTVEPRPDLTLAMAKTEARWRDRNDQPYVPEVPMSRGERLDQIKALQVKIQAGLAAFERATKTYADAVTSKAANVESLKDAAQAARAALVTSYVEMEQAKDKINDRATFYQVLREVVIPIRQRAEEVDAAFSRASGGPTPQEKTTEGFLANFLERMKALIEAATVDLAQYDAKAAEYDAAVAAGDRNLARRIRNQARRIDGRVMKILYRAQRAKKQLRNMKYRIALEQTFIDPLRARIDAAYSHFRKGGAKVVESAAKHIPRQVIQPKVEVGPVLSGQSSVEPVQRATQAPSSVSFDQIFDLGAAKEVPQVVVQAPEKKISRNEALKQLADGEMGGVAEYVRGLPDNARTVELRTMVSRYSDYATALARSDLAVSDSDFKSQIAQLERELQHLEKRSARSRGVIEAASERDRAIQQHLGREQEHPILSKVPFLRRLVRSPYADRAEALIARRKRHELPSTEDALTAWNQRHLRKAGEKKETATLIADEVREHLERLRQEQAAQEGVISTRKAIDEEMQKLRGKIVESLQEG